MRQSSEIKPGDVTSRYDDRENLGAIGVIGRGAIVDDPGYR
jgi:hypothetical protein